MVQLLANVSRNVNSSINSLNCRAVHAPKAVRDFFEIGALELRSVFKIVFSGRLQAGLVLTMKRLAMRLCCCKVMLLTFC